LQIEVFNIYTLSTVPAEAAKAKVEGLDLDGAYKFSDAFELCADTGFLPTTEYTSFPSALAYLPPIGTQGTDYRQRLRCIGRAHANAAPFIGFRAQPMPRKHLTEAIV
jgi:hypothetical protein